MTTGTEQSNMELMQTLDDAWNAQDVAPASAPTIRAWPCPEMMDAFYKQTEVLAPLGIADAVAYMVTYPRHTAIGELWVVPADQV